jgi:hypothetical protein
MQSFYNFVQYGADNLLNVTLVQVRILRRNALYQFGLYHCHSAGAGKLQPQSVAPTLAMLR